MYNDCMETNAQKPVQYRMPHLTDEFLYQIIFCMEDQSNEYCLDLKEGSLVQVEFIDQRRKEDPERFLDIPEWYPSDGFRTMEKFVSTLRNPVYRERLREALQSGKGVFRQFKDTLHSSPPLERLWYYYKDKEIRHRIHLWYERHDEAFRLSGMGEVPAEHTNELLLEDFQFVQELEQWIEQIDELGKRIIDKYEHSQNQRDVLMAQYLKEAWEKTRDDFYFIAISSGEKFAGFIKYRCADNSLVQVVCYAIEEEFQGLGLFRHMVENLSGRLWEKGYRELIFPFTADTFKIEPMFDETVPIPLFKKISVSLERWGSSSEDPYDAESFV